MGDFSGGSHFFNLLYERSGKTLVNAKLRITVKAGDRSKNSHRENIFRHSFLQ